MSNLLLVVLFLCAALSFLMSGMEAGVFALSRLRIRHLLRHGSRRAAVLYGYLEKPENFLWTILVGNILANIGVVSIIVLGLYQLLSRWPWVLLPALAASMLLYYAACELLPKMVFRLYPNRLCLALALPFRAVHFLLRPLVALVTVLSRLLLRWSGGRRFTGHLFGTRDELRLVMQESAQSLTTDERTMINRVLDLQNLVLRQVTIPLSKTVMVSAQASLDEVIDLARTNGFNRFPIWTKEGDRVRITGLLNLRSLLYQESIDPKQRAGDFVKPALYLDEETRLEVALRQMQRTGQRLAIVLSRDRKEVGIVGLQDILQVIFGDVKL